MDDNLKPELSEEELNLFWTIENLCKSKAEEFALLGYDRITDKDIWEYVVAKFGKDGNKPIHQIVNEIMSLKVTHYMNWMTMNAWKGVQL